MELRERKPALGVAAGPDGNIWFTQLAGMIGRITPAGVITEFSVPPGAIISSPYAIVAGADGNIWFTEVEGNNIDRHHGDGRHHVVRDSDGA